MIEIQKKAFWQKSKYLGFISDALNIVPQNHEIQAQKIQ
jgi:hypothetical protein